MFPILRMILIILASFALAIFLPILPAELEAHLINPVALVVVFGLIIGFFINAARARWAKLNSCIASELSRTRRVHHIVGQLDSINSEQINQVKTAISDYLTKFREIDFNDYEKTNPLFRKITKPIYSFTRIEHPHDIALYKELLASLRDWALVRQSIFSGLKHRLSNTAWLILTISAILPVVGLLFGRLSPLPSKLVIGASVTMIFLVLELLYEIEKISPSERKNFARRYIENTERLKEK